MSTIAVNAITDANGGSTTSINGTTPNAYNTVGKNLIINGAMQIAQKGTSATGITGGSATRTVDRFKFLLSNIGTYTVSQDTDAPDGFSNSFKIACTTADASSSAGDYLIIYHSMEGLMCQHLAKGTSSAKSVTLSFWVKCNKTGDMQVNLRDVDNNRNIGTTVTVNSADTWEKKTITFAGDTTGALDNDVNESLRLEFFLDSGTTYSSGAVPTSWETVDNSDRNAGGTLALSDSTSNYINITGVQLEVGESATEFEHRPYTTELLLCQRYYFSSLSTASKHNYIGQAITTTRVGAGVQFPVQMRTDPTSTIYSPNETAGSVAAYNNVGTDIGSGFTAASTNVGGIYYVTNGSGLTAGNWYAFRVTADAEL